jgi:hypothetical protein
VARKSQWQLIFGGLYDLLIVLGYATITSFTMLASQGHANHTWNAKVRLVEFPQAQKLIDGCLLLSKTAKLRDKTWFVEHSAKVEISAQGIQRSESNIANRVGRKCS